MEYLHHLVSVDTAPIEEDKLAVLRERLGHEGCRDFVDESIFLIVERLGYLQKQMVAGNFEEIYHAANSVHLLSEQIGISDVARVARDAMNCAVQGDQNALKAVVARLERSTQSALTVVADRADQKEE